MTLSEAMARRAKPELQRYYSMSTCSCSHLCVMHDDNGECMAPGCTCDAPRHREARKP